VSKRGNTTVRLNLVWLSWLWFVVVMYLRFTQRANADGTVVRYVAKRWTVRVRCALEVHCRRLDFDHPGFVPTVLVWPARLAGSVDRVVGILLINAVRVTLCHGPRPGLPAPSIRFCLICM
jgi:hypothetical protein